MDFQGLYAQARTKNSETLATYAAVFNFVRAFQMKLNDLENKSSTPINWFESTIPDREKQSPEEQGDPAIQEILLKLIRDPNSKDARDHLNQQLVKEQETLGPIPMREQLPPEKQGNQTIQNALVNQLRDLMEDPPLLTGAESWAEIVNKELKRERENGENGREER